MNYNVFLVNEDTQQNYFTKLLDHFTRGYCKMMKSATDVNKKDLIREMFYLISYPCQTCTHTCQCQNLIDIVLV